jgi:hypothetical protein
VRWLPSVSLKESPVTFLPLLSQENGLEAQRHDETYDIWRGRVDGLPEEKLPKQSSFLFRSFEVRCLSFPSFRPYPQALFSPQQIRLVLFQAISVILDILSLALPLHQNYTPSPSLDGLHSPPTFFGTTTSSAGYLVVSIFIALRWSLVLTGTAGAFPPSTTFSTLFSLSSLLKQTSAPTLRRPSAARHHSHLTTSVAPLLRPLPPLSLPAPIRPSPSTAPSMTARKRPTAPRRLSLVTSLPPQPVAAPPSLVKRVCGA